MEALHYVFGYLKLHPKRKLAFNAQHPMISERMFKKHDWNDFYRGVKEAIPGNMPKPRGNTMTMHCFVNASHGSDRATRRSQIGILIFCNSAPVTWHIKRQNTVEARTFGSETRRSQTGILIFCNSAPVTWHSKQQNTVASTFRSEFQAMKSASN